MSLLSKFRRDRTFHQPINWGVTLIMIGLHVCALAAISFSPGRL